MAASFLLRFQEPAGEPSASPGARLAGTKTLTETREEPDQDVGFYGLSSESSGNDSRVFGTMTKTRAIEEPDQDIWQLSGLSAPGLGDAGDPRDPQPLMMGTKTATAVREEPDQDVSNLSAMPYGSIPANPAEATTRAVRSERVRTGTETMGKSRGAGRDSDIIAETSGGAAALGEFPVLCC